MSTITKLAIKNHPTYPGKPAIDEKFVEFFEDTGYANAVSLDSIAVPDNAPVVGQVVIAITGTAVALASVETPLPSGYVSVHALNTNSGEIVVGNDDVANVIDGSGNGYILEAGESQTFFVSDLSLLYVNGYEDDIATFSAS